MKRMRSSDSESKQASRGDRWQRAALAALGVLGTVSLLGLAGCPADLEDPSRFEPASAGAAGTGVAGGGSIPGGNVDTTCLTAVFTKDCASLPGCHKATMSGAGLDLASPGVNARLIDVPSKHTDLVAPDGAGCPTGDKLIDTANPAASWLLQKLKKTRAELGCGYPMPLGEPLPAEDLACIEKYVTDVSNAVKGGT